MNYTTQMAAARQGIVTKQMQEVIDSKIRVIYIDLPPVHRIEYDRKKTIETLRAVLTQV